MKETKHSSGNPTGRVWNEGNLPAFPFMEPEGIALLRSHLLRADTYLEYGAGGSSVMALEAGVPSIHSVDSDKGLLEALLRKSEKSASKLHAYHGDLGMSGDWGFPLNNESSEKWPLYSAGVWATLLRENARPDLILIDGRFRVACFLASCWFAKEGTVILFDDYQDRPHYHVVERHIKPSLQVGRMALFKKEGVLSEALLADMMLSVTDVR